MAAPDSSDLRQAVSRLTLHLGAVHGLVALIFLLCLHHIYPVEASLKSAILVHAALTIAALGALLQSFTWGHLWPVRKALARAEPRDASLVECAARRAALLPRRGAAVTFLLSVVGGLLIREKLASVGLQRDSVNAGLLIAVSTGVVAALLYYYVALSGLFLARLALRERCAPARGTSVGTRILVTCSAILLVGVVSVGTTAYLHHRFGLERSAVATCDRSLRALATLDAPLPSVMNAVAMACGGSVAVTYQGRVQASLGEAEIADLPRGRNGRGVLLSTPLQGDRTLYALVTDAAWQEEGSAFAAAMAFFALMGLLLALSVALVASRALTVRLRGLAQGAEAIARGDLTREVPVLAGDEIGSLASSFAAMTVALRQFVRNISNAAENVTRATASVTSAGGCVQHSEKLRRDSVASATREMRAMDRSVAEVGRDISGLGDSVASTGVALAMFATSLEEVRRHGSDLQAAVGRSRSEVQAILRSADAVRRDVVALAQAARSTLSTIGESGQMLRALADAARDGERVAQRLFEETQRGTHVVDQGVRGVEAIRGVVASAKAHVQALGARSSDITAVVDFIADVAGRTNLLSLNAAIIASQAGEHGKPFGVVADHIRELAAQIGSSTQRIDDIIAGVRLEVEATSALIEQSDELAATGVERAQEGGEALKRIAAESKRAREIAASIPPVVTRYTESACQIEQLAARVVEMSQGFTAVELLSRGGRSIESLAHSLAPLTLRVGHALEAQAAMSQEQVESLSEITRIIARLDETVEQHGEGTSRTLKGLNDLVSLAEGDRRAVDQLASAAQALTRHAAALREGLEQFRF